MNCCSNIIPDIPPVKCTDLNARVLNFVFTLPDGARKIIRLLAKQYDIYEIEHFDDSIYMKPDTETYIRERLIIRKQEVAIFKYRNEEGQKFEWKIQI